MESLNSTSNAQLRKVLSLMFPKSYIQLYHQSPNSVCSLLQTRCWPQSDTSAAAAAATTTTTDPDNNEYLYLEASTEPISRTSLITLREHFDASLAAHQAKRRGLCPIRRAIYNQCFDELIRQVTVGCVEQGLLLYRIRNEIRMTIGCYQKAYESGVTFGLRKAILAETQLEEMRAQVELLKKTQDKFDQEAHLRNRISEVDDQNKLESVDKLHEYYNSEIKRRDQVIEQQRSVIRLLSQKYTSDIRNPFEG